jgi:hypothetical protein
MLSFFFITGPFKYTAEFDVNPPGFLGQQRSQYCQNKNKKSDEGCSTGSNPPAAASFASIIENSPRDVMVNPMLVRSQVGIPGQAARGDPGDKVAINVSPTAARAARIAPLRERGSMLSPKLKKKHCPK